LLFLAAPDIDITTAVMREISQEFFARNLLQTQEKQKEKQLKKSGWVKRGGTYGQWASDAEFARSNSPKSGSSVTTSETSMGGRRRGRDQNKEAFFVKPVWYFHRDCRTHLTASQTSRPK
jgi:hypothetical protein